MKICVYTIAKNESQFVERFMACVKEADQVIVTDTGSTDDTVSKLRALGAIVYEEIVNPWRFDVARNISLSHVPHDVDVCVCIDLDEVLTPGWRAAVEAAFTANPKATRLRYPYVWNVLPDGKPGVTFWYEKIHRRHNYKWVKPVHEILENSAEEVQVYSNGFTLYHFPDPTKSRSNYLPLLELGCQEAPEDDRNSHYLGREYMYYKMFDKAIAELQRHLSLKSATWDAERSSSMRYIAKCYASKGDFNSAFAWAMRSSAECPSQREPWVELGKICYHLQDWEGTYFAMIKALKIEEKPMSYICEPESWGHVPYDIASIAAGRLGLIRDAVNLCKKALDLQPNDERLRKNYELLCNRLNVQPE